MARDTGRVSFLDNLENNLKALESLEAGGVDDRARRDAERARSAAEAPWAERLKSSAFANKLMRDLTREGFTRRMKVHFVWIGRVLRAEAMEERLELQPTSGGVEAVFAGKRLPVDLDAQPDALIREWLTILDARRKAIDAERAAAAAANAEEFEEE